MLDVDVDDKDAQLPAPLKDGDPVRRTLSGEKLWNPPWNSTVGSAGSKEFINALTKLAIDSAEVRTTERQV